MRKLILRADSSPEIGLGHLYRMVSLAYMFANYFDCYFVTNEPNNMPFEFRELNIPVIRMMNHKYTIPAKKKQEDELIFDLDELLQGGEIVIIDGYWFGTTYQRKIKEKNCHLVCIDDSCNIEFYADLIINHSPGITESKYKAQAYTNFALGPSYAMIRPLFLAQARKKKRVTSLSSLVICFGGSDFLNLTFSVVEKIIQASRFSEISVVIGKAYKFESELREFIKEREEVTIFKDLNEADLLSLMIRSDVAIVPASGILFEALAVGCITLSGYYSDNQRNIYEGFLSSGAIFGCGDFSELDDSLSAFFLMAKTWQPSLEAIDGLSGERLTSILNTLPTIHN